MSNIDTKTIGGWIITILLSLLTAFTMSSSRVQRFQNTQDVQDLKIETLEKLQKEILDNVKETNKTVTNIEIQLNNKADKKWLR